MQTDGTDIHDSSTPAGAKDMRLWKVETPTAKLLLGVVEEEEEVVVVGIFRPYWVVRLTLAAQRIICTAFTTSWVWVVLCR